MKIEENKEEKIAEIKYTLLEDESIKLDIEIDDYNEKCIDGLSRLCAGVASEQLIYETISYIRDKLVENNNTSMLVYFVSQINKYSEIITKLDNNDKPLKTEEPCIKPSDML